MASTVFLPALFFLGSIDSPGYTESLARPFLLLLCISFWPVFTRDLDKKPWARARFLFLGWYVCDI
jgi:hypothetical protein